MSRGRRCSIAVALLGIATAGAPFHAGAAIAGPDGVVQTVVGLTTTDDVVRHIVDHAPTSSSCEFRIRAGLRETAGWVAAIRAAQSRDPDREFMISVRPDAALVRANSDSLPGGGCGGRMTPDEVVREIMQGVVAAKRGTEFVYVLDPAILDARETGVAVRAARESLEQELRTSGVRVTVVGPEGRFGCDATRVEIPQVPWTPRPIVRDWNEREPDFLRPRRFDSSTATYIRARRWDSPRITDCPSGRGLWWLAALAATGERSYVIYPRQPRDWLDVCRFSPALRSSTAPTLDPAAPASEATKWMAAESARLRRAPFWTVGGGRNGADAWTRRDAVPICDFLSRDSAAQVTAAQVILSQRGDRMLAALASDLRESADRAAPLAEAAIAGSRDRANLLLFRYWLESAAFTVESVRPWARRESRRRADAPNAEVVLAELSLVRMSEVLQRPSGNVVVSDEQEKENREDEIALGLTFTDDDPAPVPLLVAQTSPLYRGMRRTERVVERIPAELKSQATRAIAAARRLMSEYAESPWGWMVYYSELCIHVHHWGGAPGDGIILPPADPNPPSADPPASTPSGGDGPATGR